MTFHGSGVWLWSYQEQVSRGMAPRLLTIVAIAVMTFLPSDLRPLSKNVPRVHVGDQSDPKASLTKLKMELRVAIVNLSYN